MADPLLETIRQLRQKTQGQIDPLLQVIQEEKRSVQPQLKIQPKGYFEELAGNILPSAYETGKAYIQPIIHPIETGKGMLGLAQGLIEKTVPGTFPEQEQMADAMWNMVVERYGGLENIGRTFKTDPVGLMADVATLFAGGGAALKGAGAAGKISQLSKAGRMASQVGRVLEPSWAAGKVAGAAISPLKAAAKHGLGVTTGMGSKTLEYAMRGKPGFMRGLRGGTKVLEETLEESKSALQSMKDARSTDYSARLNKISQITGDLDITPIKNELIDQIKKNRLQFDQSGKIIRGTIDPKHRGDAQRVIDLINEWGTQSGDLTPLGVDELKRTLDDFYSESKSTNAMITTMRGKTKDVLVKNIPDYAEMVKNYELSSDLINEIRQGLSLKNKTSSDASIRKLISSLNDNQDFRRSLVEQLEKHGGSELLDKLAGMKMEELVPSGLIGRGAAAGAAGTAIFGNSPQMLIGLSLTSPRLMGGLMWTLSNAVKQYRRIPTGAKLGAFQAGRVKTLDGTIP